jgi:Kef-type K+ transport system membrane component KefB
MFFTPVFFASIGLKAVIPAMSSEIIWFSILIVVVSILSKVIGCGLGAKICKLPNISALRIGVGMICRGEVALIIATKGVGAGLMKEEFFTPIILMVIITTVVTPILLKIVYKDRGHTTVYAEDPLAERLKNKDHCEIPVVD